MTSGWRRRRVSESIFPTFIILRESRRFGFFVVQPASTIARLDTPRSTFIIRRSRVMFLAYGEAGGTGAGKFSTCLRLGSWKTSLRQRTKVPRQQRLIDVGALAANGFQQIQHASSPTGSLVQRVIVPIRFSKSKAARQIASLDAGTGP